MIMVVAMFMAMTTEPSYAAPQKNAEKVQPANAQNSVPTLTEGQVVLEGKPLLTIKAKTHSFSPVDRAKTISERLAKLVKDPLFHVDSIKVIDGENTSDIVTGDLILMSVSEVDAQAEGKARLVLAEEFAVRIRSAVDTYNREYSMQTILFGALYTLLATLTLIAALFVIKRFLPE